MAKNYEVGEKYYLPVKVEEVANTNYGVKISFEDGAGVDTTHICEFPDVLLTADEIAIMPHTGMTDALEELKTKVASLQEENEKLTAWYNEANKTASEAVEANDDLKAKIAELRAENEKLKADCNDWKDTADDRIVDVQNLTAENDKLKQKLKDAEGAYNVVADTSLERKNRVTTMEEVIVALVEKIRRLEGDET